LKPLSVCYKSKGRPKIFTNNHEKYQIHYNVKVSILMNLIELLEKNKLEFNETYKLAIIITTIPV